jgi:hypothetical protein
MLLLIRKYCRGMHRIIATIVGLVTGGLGVTALTAGTQAANAALASN